MISKPLTKNSALLRKCNVKRNVKPLFNVTFIFSIPEIKWDSLSEEKLREYIIDMTE